jgi:hypothetical protein
MAQPDLNVSSHCELDGRIAGRSGRNILPDPLQNRLGLLPLVAGQL